MIPYNDVWRQIQFIIMASPSVDLRTQVDGYDAEIYQELVRGKDEYYLTTYRFTDKIDQRLSHKDDIDFTYRYKYNESIKLKLERLTLKKKLHKVANDILAMRFILKCSEEDLKEVVKKFVSQCPFEDACTIVDQTEGKRSDDGYKGIHVYIKVSNSTFPIEIQFWTRTHALLNQYLHANIYKIDDSYLNQYALDLRDWLANVPSIPASEGLEVQNYVDYIYEQAFGTSNEDALNDDLVLDDNAEDDFFGNPLDEEE